MYSCGESGVVILSQMSPHSQYYVTNQSITSLAVMVYLLQYISCSHGISLASHAKVDGGKVQSYLPPVRNLTRLLPGREGTGERTTA